jgi:cation transport ATPase
MKNIYKRLSLWALIVAAVLSIPYLAKFPWTMSDFVFAGVVLFGAATVYELTTKNLRNKTHRIAVGIGVATVIFFIWGLAVA